MKIAIASDHAGFAYKQQLIEYLRSRGHLVTDFGTHSPDSMDYPDTAHPLAAAVESGAHDRGIVLCGSGNGISMTVNKHQGIRCALCWNMELADLARRHNDANVLCFGARVVGEELAKMIVDEFINASFLGDRHLRRVEMITDIEKRG